MASPRAVQGVGGSKRWPGTCRRAATTHTVSDWRELDDDWQRQVVGWPAIGVGPGKSFSLFIFLCFCCFLFL